MINFYQSQAFFACPVTPIKRLCKAVFLSSKPSIATHIKHWIFTCFPRQVIQSLKNARVSSRFPPTKNCNTQRLSAASVVGTVKKLPQQTLPSLRSQQHKKTPAQDRSLVQVWKNRVFRRLPPVRWRWYCRSLRGLQQLRRDWRCQPDSACLR